MGKKQTIDCPACGDTMKRKSVADGGAVGCLLLLVGVVVSFTGIGLIIGVPMILLGLHYGMKRKGVWRCQACDHEIPRKLGMFEWG